MSVCDKRGQKKLPSYDHLRSGIASHHEMRQLSDVRLRHGEGAFGNNVSNSWTLTNGFKGIALHNRNVILKRVCLLCTLIARLRLPVFLIIAVNFWSSDLSHYRRNVSRTNGSSKENIPIRFPLLIGVCIQMDKRLQLLRYIVLKNMLYNCRVRRSQTLRVCLVLSGCPNSVLFNLLMSPGIPFWMYRLVGWRFPYITGDR